MTRSTRVARNIITTFISQVVSWSLSFAVILYLPHYAGAKGLGEITLAAAFASVFGLVSSVGSSTVLMRDIPRDPPSAGRLILASLIIRVPLAILSVGLGLIAGKALGYGSQMILLVGISLAGSIAGVISDTLSSAVRGLETFSVANIGSVIDKVISSFIIVLVCIDHGSIWLIVAAPLISTSIASAYMFYAIRSFAIQWSMPDLAAIKSLAVAGLPFVSVGIFIAIYSKSDAIFLSKLSTTESIGWYGLATRIGGTAMALPAAVCSAMLPALSTLYREDRAAFVGGVARLINLMVLCSIPFSAAMIFCPDSLIAFVSHRTASFLPAMNVVRIYGVAMILWFLSQAAFTGIIACNQQKRAALSMGVAAVVSIPTTAGCIFFAEHFYHNGAIGAALSDVFIEVFLLSCYFFILPKGAVSPSLLSITFRSLVAAAPLVAALYLLSLKLAIAVAFPCLAIYGILCMQFKCLHVKDVQLFRQLIGGKFGLSKA